MNIAPIPTRASARPRPAASFVAAIMCAPCGLTLYASMESPALPVRISIEANDRTFASGLLLELVSALRRTAVGELIAVTARNAGAIEADLDAWSRLTGHAI